MIEINQHKNNTLSCLTTTYTKLKKLTKHSLAKNKHCFKSKQLETPIMYGLNDKTIWALHEAH